MKPHLQDYKCHVLTLILRPFVCVSQIEVAKAMVDARFVPKAVELDIPYKVRNSL